MASSSRRRRLLVDRRVQGALLLRVVLYWFTTLLGVLLLVSCWLVAHQSPLTSGELVRLWTSFGIPALAASAIILPLVLIDCLRISNRFSGPAYRLEQALRGLADGKPVRPIHLRKGDFWFEIATNLNRVAQRVERLEAAATGLDQPAAAPSRTACDERARSVSAVR